MDHEDYEDFLGQEAYEDHVMNPFDDFLHKAFYANPGPTPEIESNVTVSPSHHVNASMDNRSNASPSGPVHVPSNDVDFSPSAPVEPTLSPSDHPTHALSDDVATLIKPTPALSLSTASSQPGISAPPKEPLVPSSTEASSSVTSMPVSPSTQTTSTTSPTGTATQMDVDGDDDAPDSTMALPTWLRNSKMPDYLRGVSKEKAWQELVTSLFMFEAVNTTTGNLPTTSRPDEVASWIKSKKKDLPPEVDVDPYGSSFMAWWIAIQPRWRLTDNATFVYDVPSDEDWHFLHKGGSAGLYVVVVALSWWIRVLPAEPLPLRAWSAVRDVRWVIDQICMKVSSNSKGTKRARNVITPEATQPSKAKRHRSD
ncbi:hypothetical protein K443DRAFT_135619 [Laccaria amethystina LaAM-08-1]|uniref:Uncharacterized protein n=1 Tax=Laccaria amethystina LaAM-08-1 TaxID=1095629 RepID=A0A0C9WM20_9AGAR|nr:hypothetical protein K443DRAFT_135619 [Laccaria amethystina LaAM-08-1]